MRSLSGVRDVDDPVGLLLLDPLTESRHVGRVVGVAAVGFHDRQRDLAKSKKFVRAALRNRLPA